MENRKLYPLTHPQKGILNTEKTFPNTSIGNVAGSLWIKTNINFEYLEQAINMFVKNNDGMRIRMTTHEGCTCQIISKFCKLKVDLLKFNSNTELYKWNQIQSMKPFNIFDEDLFYFAMINVSDGDSGFYVKTHHLISDAWNMSIIGNEVVRYYKLISNTQKSEEGKKPSYVDYIISEENYKQSQRFQKDKAFWYSKFEHVPEATILKTKNKTITTKSTRKTLLTSDKFANKLRKYCSENRISPYPLFLSALAMYLNRVTSKKDLIIGTPILNRTTKKEKSTAGMFISTVPLKLHIDNTENFSVFSKQISTECMSILRHQKFPYDILLDSIKKRHQIAGNIYDIVLSYQNTKFHTNGDLNYFTRWHFNGHQSNSLTIHVNDRDDDGCLIIDYDYHSDMYYDKEIEFIHKHMISLLWHALDNPTKEINKIDMLPEDEKSKILFDFNNTTVPYAKEKTIHSIFEEQVKKSPTSTALICNDQHMTYKELNQKANQLAKKLITSGVTSETIVGIMLRRSFEMIIGILAIIKAGGAYLPIDPDYPLDRVAYMLKDSNAPILLVSNNNDTMADFAGETINISNSELYTGDNSNPSVSMHSENIIYVIYTSGSTGNPKGVLIEHHSVVNRITWMQKKYPIDVDSTLIQKTPFTFDVSVWELFWWFFVGAKLVILEPAGEKSPSILVDNILKNSVTTIHFVPSMLTLFLDYVTKHNFINRIKSLEQVFSSGEALEINHVNTFNKLLYLSNKTELYNLYGPTEATVDVSYFDCSNKLEHTVIPIGKPIDNTQLYILDKQRNLQPIGIEGELYIAGAGLARGYLNEKELTDEKFVEDPFTPGAKMYKTGDLARWFPKGDIEYLGRIDHQVKIRGFRIELNEIKVQLLKHPSIKDAVVTIKENGKGAKFICAYIIFETSVTVSDLKNHMSMNLPNYMIPAYFIELDAMPLSHNGKTNMKLLPNPKTSAMKDEYFIRPRTNDEKQILKAWYNVLELENISIRDNFFNLGGDSLSVIKVVNALDDRITYLDVYNYPTIELLAQKLNKNISKNKGMLMNLLESKVDNPTTIICFPYGGGNYIIYKDLSDALVNDHNHFSLYSINLPGHNIQNNLKSLATIDTIAEKIIHEIEDNIKGDIILYGHCVGSALTLEVARLLEKKHMNLSSVLIGGVLPPKNIKLLGKSFNPWKLSSDKQITHFLSKIGLPEVNMTNEDMKYMMNAFRHDVKSFYEYFYTHASYNYDKLSTPIYCVFGENDKLTKKYRYQYKNWGKYTNKVAYFEIKNAHHYFIKNNAQNLADIISKINIREG